MNRRHHAFVLLTTLALLVLTATLLVAVGRIAIARSLAASAASDELQRTWALASCRSALLPHAETLLTRAEVDQNRRVKQIAETIALGDQTLTITLCDEQAKANINLLLEHQTTAAVEDRLRDLFSGSGLLNQIHLTPTDDDDPATQPTTMLPESIHSYGQIVAGCTPEQMFELAGVSPAANLTCWGSGPINLLRADEPAMRLALWPTLSRVQIDRLVLARDALLTRSRSIRSDLTQLSTNHGSVDYLMQQAKIDAKTASQLIVTDHSTCHSLWIVLKDRQRNWYTSSVVDDSLPRNPRRENFTW